VKDLSVADAAFLLCLSAHVASQIFTDYRNVMLVEGWMCVGTVASDSLAIRLMAGGSLWGTGGLITGGMKKRSEMFGY
jgi:hypothetical protein